MAKTHGGKGDKQRPRKVSKQKFDDNWDRIFGNKTLDGTTDNQRGSTSR
jgi:hypothetical protein